MYVRNLLIFYRATLSVCMCGCVEIYRESHNDRNRHQWKTFYNALHIWTWRIFKSIRHVQAALDGNLTRVKNQNSRVSMLLNLSTRKTKNFKLK